MTRLPLDATPFLEGYPKPKPHVADTETGHLAQLAREALRGNQILRWETDPLYRLQRDLWAAANTGHELPEETLKAARDFLGVLVGR